MDLLAQLKIIGTVSMAAVLGGLIGLERQFAEKPAGFRTHMLIAGAAALLMALGDPLVAHFAPVADGGLLRIDPIRLIEAIVTAIAFLGAGTILRRGGETAVEGLTTAGSILMAGIIGICVALHQLLLACGVTLLTLVMLRVLGRLEKRFGIK